MPSSTLAGVSIDQRRLPGELGIWMFVIGDMLIFGVFFAAYLYYRGLEVALFDRSQGLLDVRVGLAYTLLLVSSSWAVVMAIDMLRRAEARRARWFLALAAFCGMAFFVVKIVEWTGKIDLGITPQTNFFFMFYFMLTGIHLLHLTLGLVFLGVMAARTRGADPLPFCEVGATFWHTVDLLWIVLFPLLYLLR